jgi:hypothetical protein
LSSDANGEAEVSYESLQKMVQGLVKGLDVEMKEISVEAATVLSVNPKQLMDECEELLAQNCRFSLQASSDGLSISPSTDD